MENILYELFSGEYDITPKRGKRQQELRDKIFTELDKVEAAFGIDYLDHLFDLDGEWNEWKNFQYYRSGFLLGARLMLEALGDQPSI